MIEFLNAQLTTDQYMTHYWPISCGTMQDQIGTAHMTQGNLTSFTLDRFGTANEALALNGGWTRVPSGIYFNTPEFTISVWVYPNSLSNWSRVLDFSNTCQGDSIVLILSVGASRQPALFLALSSMQNAISLHNLVLSQWQFLVGTFDGVNLKVYLNGQLEVTSAFAFNLPTITRSNCYIGKSNCFGDGYSFSYFDDLRFYNKSLTHTEILQLMNQSSTCK
jgi:hypothetical protein